MIILVFCIVLLAVIEPFDIIKKIKMHIIVKVLLNIVSIFASALILYIIFVFKKIRRRIEEYLYNQF